MTQFTKSEHATKWLPVKSLTILWPDAQRPLDEKHVDRLAKNFDPDMFGVISVCKPNGKEIYHVIDGNHRRLAIEKLFGPDEMVPCNVFDAPDPARAAKLFNEINTGRRPVNAVDRFRVRVTSGAPTEVAVSAIIKNMGYRVSSSTEDGAVRAVAACTKVFKRFGGEVLTISLLTSRTAWGKVARGTDEAIIGGLSEFYAEFGPQVDRGRLCEKLAKSFTPDRLLGAARSARDVYRCSTASAVSRVIQNLYNSGLRAGKLESRKSAA
jgi:hypothetical protein